MRQKRLVFLIVLLLLAALALLLLLRQPAASKSPKKAAPVVAPSTRAKPAITPVVQTTELTPVKVEIIIPPLSQFPAPWAQGEGCPHTRLVKTLRATVGMSNGVPVVAVEPDGPAAKAGIKVGDRLGDPDACPNTIQPLLAPEEKQREVEWTIYRPKSDTSANPAQKQSPRTP
jgi:hypothetical protein